MNRPTVYDEDVRRCAAAKLWERIKEQADGDVGNDSESIESIASAIRFYDDGYKVARELEREGWDPDARMVEILDDAWLEKMRACDDATRMWVAENGITPALSVGALVKFKDLSVGRIGEVTNIDADRAKYHVFCEELGHVRDGNGTHAVILNYEDVEAV